LRELHRLQTYKPLCISIVTPSLDQGQFIEETIRSVLSQEGDFILDYQVIDGGSTDNSLKVIKKFAGLIESGSWPTRCRGLRYRWVSKPDKGQVSAINEGFFQADGEVIAWLNSDDVYNPYALQRVAAVEWAKTDFCYGRGMWISRNGNALVEYPTYKPSHGALYFQCTLCQPTVFISKRAFTELGPLSENYQNVFDYEYWLRAIFRNMTFKNTTDYIAYSRMHFHNKSLSCQPQNKLEIDKLLDEYYGKRGIGLLKNRYYSFNVDIPTKKRVLELLVALENSP
jgi:glycosyltransferase involved in cell wall biosynthesis